jgi:hypothetical protein
MRSAGPVRGWVRSGGLSAAREDKSEAEGDDISV